MTLAEILSTEKSSLEAYLSSPRGIGLEQNQLERLIALNKLLENINQSTILPTGVATSAKQDVGNNSLSNIDAKLPSLLNGRTPVDIGGDGSITITSGTVTVANEVEIKNDVGNPVPVNGTVASTQSGTWNLANITGTVSLPTGAATSANQIPAFTVSAKTLGTANAATVKASAGKVYSLSVTNLNASVRYLQIVNKASTPTNSDSASIVDVWTIPANGTIIIDSPYYGANGLSCSTGISWAFSSTATTITLATAGDCLVSVGYV